MTQKKTKVLKVFLYILLGILVSIFLFLASYRTLNKDFQRVITQTGKILDRYTSHASETTKPATLVEDSYLHLVCSDDSSANAVAVVTFRTG